MTREELIGRLMTAVAPDRGYDAEIAAMLRIVPDHDPAHYIVPLFYRAASRPTGRVEVYWINDGEPWICHAREAPLYTGSLDAALTLVPPGAFWVLMTRGEQDDFDAQVVTREIRSVFKKQVFHHGATAALALCIAALKVGES